MFGFGTAGDISVDHITIHAVQAGFKTFVLSILVRNIAPCREMFEHQVEEVEKVGIMVTTI